MVLSEQCGWIGLCRRVSRYFQSQEFEPSPWADYDAPAERDNNLSFARVQGIAIREWRVETHFPRYVTFHEWIPTTMSRSFLPLIRY